MSRALNVTIGTLTGLLLLGCAEPPPEQGPVVRPIKMHEIGSLDPASLREYPGTIRAFQHADMGFEVEGRITDFLVREGDVVEQGAELARLDPRDYEASLKAAQADLRKAQADLTRSQNIFKEDPGAISTETIDSHERAVDVARAQLAVMEKGVEDAVLRAPFSGRVARKLVEDFANVQAKEPVLILQDTSVLEITVDVPERDMVGSGRYRDMDEITERSKPEVVVSAVADRSFPASVKEFATTADPVTRTFPVKLNFDRPDDVNILPGMTARVRVVVNPERAWSVPATAAQADVQGKPFVWKVNPSSMTVSPVEVELGEVYGERVQLKSGVEEGDVVAISGVTQLREGMKVREFKP